LNSAEFMVSLPVSDRLLNRLIEVIVDLSMKVFQ